MRRDRRLSELAALYERDFAAFVRVSRGIVGDGTKQSVRYRETEQQCC